jgi:WD40 repeat protein
MGLRFATVRVWDLASGKQLFVLEGQTRPGSTASVRPMFFAPDQRTLVTAESLDDSTVRIWDLPAK